MSPHIILNITFEAALKRKVIGASEKMKILFVLIIEEHDLQNNSCRMDTSKALKILPSISSTKTSSAESGGGWVGGERRKKKKKTFTFL